MKTFRGLTFEELQEKDIAILAPIMKRAFDEDARIHLGEEQGGPPGYDNGDFLRRYAIEDEASTAFQFSMEGRIIGAVILWIDDNTNQNILGNLFIDASIENKGLGKTVWDFIEREFPQTKIWRTDTPIFSHRNHHFYINKCGFHVVRIENPKNLKEGSFILEKKMS